MSQVIHDALIEAAVVEEPPQLSLAIDGHDKAAPAATADNTRTGETTKRERSLPRRQGYRGRLQATRGGNVSHAYGQHQLAWSGTAQAAEHHTKLHAALMHLGWWTGQEEHWIGR